jgi:hypothetical protein
MIYIYVFAIVVLYETHMFLYSQCHLKNYIVEYIENEKRPEKKELKKHKLVILI